MQKLYQRFFYNIGIFFGLVLFGFIYHRNLIYSFLYGPVIGGWDGSGHYMVTKLYSEHIFPRLYGILPQFYAGLLWPVGFPPLMSYSFGLLHFILPNISFLWLYKSVFVGILLCSPYLAYHIQKKIGVQKEQAFFGGILFVIAFAGTEKLGGDWGFMASSLIGVGLHAQFFSLIWLLLFLLFLFSGTWDHTIYTVLRGIAAGLAFLANVHTAQAVLIIVCLHFIWHIRYKNIRLCIRIISIFIFSFISVTGIWLALLIRYYVYFPTQILPSLTPNALVRVGAPFLLSVWGMRYAIINRNTRYMQMFLFALFLIIFSFTPFYLLHISTPLQPYRIFAVSIVLLFLLSSYAIQCYMHGVPFFLRVILYIVVLVPFVTLWYQPVRAKHLLEPNTLTRNEQQFIAYINTLKGRSLFETPDGTFSSKLISTYGVNSGVHETLWEVFRESTLSSTFIPPLRNAFSTRQESFGVICFLCHNDSFRNTNVVEHFYRSQLYGVTHFIGKTPYFYNQLERLRKVGIVKRIATFDTWRVYMRTKNEYTETTALRAPVLIVTDLLTKHRKEEGFDFLRMSEAYFEYGFFQTPLIFAHKKLHKYTPETLDIFSHIIVVVDSKKIQELNELETKTRAGLTLFVPYNMQDSHMRHKIQEVVTQIKKKNIFTKLEIVWATTEPQNDRILLLQKLNISPVDIGGKYLLTSYYPLFFDNYESRFLAAPSITYIRK